MEAVFKESSPVSSNYFLYLLERFLASDKNTYSLTYFPVLGSIEYCCIAKLEERQINFIFYFLLSTILIPKCYDNFIKLSIVLTVCSCHVTYAFQNPHSIFA